MTASLLNTLRKRSTIQSADLRAAGAAGPCFFFLINIYWSRCSAGR